jgi:hypothetical protein
MKRKALIIFVKFPEPGKVKTRLALNTNDSFALKFYNALAQNTFEVVEKLDAGIDKYIYYSPISDIHLVKNWINRDFYYAEQQGTNLGQKISNAFNDLFEDGYEKIAIVGSDVPDISGSLIQNAYDFLEKRNVAIAPSKDGGYSLLGMDHYYPMLSFHNHLQIDH